MSHHGSKLQHQPRKWPGLSLKDQHQTKWEYQEFTYITRSQRKEIKMSTWRDSCAKASFVWTGSLSFSFSYLDVYGLVAELYEGRKNVFGGGTVIINPTERNIELTTKRKPYFKENMVIPCSNKMHFRIIFEERDGFQRYSIQDYKTGSKVWRQGRLDGV